MLKPFGPSVVVSGGGALSSDKDVLLNVGRPFRARRGPFRALGGLFRAIKGSFWALGGPSRALAELSGALRVSSESPGGPRRCSEALTALGGP